MSEFRATNILCEVTQLLAQCSQNFILVLDGIYESEC